ncbi:MAG TPA: glycosyltransferase family 4 protein [Chloroflexota bacterium]|nr:glycosyltransferase family 4 protein [Chloroflexota bacterium]
MKILLVHDYGTLSGGAEHATALLRDGLRRRGHDARLFASTARPLALENVADYTCYGSTSPARRLVQTANPWAVRRLEAVLREFRPDVVHLRMFLTQLSPLVLRPLAAFPTLLHVGSYELICPLLHKTLPDGSSCRHRAGVACYRQGCVSLAGLARVALQQRLRRRYQHPAAVVVANSEWTRRRLAADGIEAAEWVWTGVPERPARPPLAPPPTIAYAGRLVRKKGVDVLVRAMPLVVAARPEARLIVAGDGPERPALERLIADRALEPHVRLVGHRPRAELEALLGGAWVQAIPSRWEDPFPNAAAEAMMRGTAVVASAWGGVTEIVREGETGLLVPPGDSEALAGALLRLLHDRDLAERMGARSRDFARAELTEDHFIQRFERLYAGLRASAPARAQSALSDAAGITG